MRTTTRYFWALWAETKDGQTIIYKPAVQIQGRPPRQAERSGDGLWATLYENETPVRTWMRTNKPKTRPNND